MRRFVCLGLVLVAATFAPERAQAQASRLGPTFSLGGSTSPVTDPDVAYDSVNNRYLQVADGGFVEAHLLDANGTIIGAFRVDQSGAYAQTARVGFASGIPGGGYLVTWHRSFDKFARVMGRIFRGDGVPLTGEFDIGVSAVNAPTSSNWTMGASVSYSPASHEFLVAWMGNYTSTNDIFFQRVAENGALLGPNTLVSAGTTDWDRDPSVAYNPNTDEFLIAYAGYNEAGRYGFVAARRVKAGSGQLMAPSTVLGAAVATYMPAVSYNTETGVYLLGWFNRSASSASVYGATLDAAGNQVGDIRVLSPYYAAYDALDIDYNPPSGQYLLVTHGNGATPWEDAAVTILSSGVAYDNGFIITNTTDARGLKSDPARNDGNYNPRVTASMGEKKWLLVTASAFAATFAQFAASPATGGGGSPTPAPPPPPGPAVSRPAIALDVPFSNSTVQSQFSVSGWAVDLGATTGSGVSAVHVWAFPTNGAAPLFIGAAALGYSRPDVGSYFGDARFSGSGYGMPASLPPGVYDIRAFALSTVANAFNAVATTRVTVAAPISVPRMYVDAPAQNQTVTRTFAVGGWAIDQAATAGVGVDAVHVWAFPTNGGSPLFIGAAYLGYARPDVAAVFGKSQFTPSGFGIIGSLPPGDYNLVIYAHSSLTGTFNQASVVHIRVV
jgi:hypothetical protein